MRPGEETLRLTAPRRTRSPRGPLRWRASWAERETLSHRWRTTTAAAGIDGLRLHDLRHFFASGLIASGCDVVTVQRALWHASANTTLATYSHLWPSADDRTRTAVEHLMAAALQDRADLVRTNDHPQASDLQK